MRKEMKTFAAAVAAAVVTMLVAFVPQPSAAQEMNPVQIDEWPTPWQGRGRDPYAAGPDEIWFVGQQGHYLARFTPSTESFHKVELPDGTGPHSNTVQSNGLVWVTGNRVANLSIYDPKADEFTIIGMPDPENTQDPHTLVFDADESHAWFTVQFSNKVGRVTLADRSVDIIPVPTPGSRPYGIKVAPDGTPWIVLLGTNKLARVDPQTLELTEVELPGENARPRRIEITSDGRIWYADWDRGSLGLYDPASDRFDEFELPGGEGSRPYGMAMDDLDRVWVVATGANPNLFVGFDTASEKIVSVTEIPSGARSVRHMDYEEATGTVWFGTDTEMLGRAIVRPN